MIIKMIAWEEDEFGGIGTGGGICSAVQASDQRIAGWNTCDGYFPLSRPMLTEGSLTSSKSPLHHPWRWRQIGALIAAGIFLVGAIISVGVGAVSMPSGEILAILAGGGSSEDSTIVWNLRLPRILLCVLVGFDLAVLGAVQQGVIRNPLADIGIIGVSERAMAATFLVPLAHRPLATLPGGEHQRPWIAIALAQNATILLLGGPTIHLDVGYQGR
jgi:ABC-type Fe3+-siderophore transport system permease subunit